MAKHTYIPNTGIWYNQSILSNPKSGSIIIDTMHPSHQHQLTKLNKALGQLEAVKRMIQQRRYCVDIMTQVKAARSALKGIELAILETHMQSCLAKAIDNHNQDAQQQIESIIQLLKKYE